MKNLYQDWSDKERDRFDSWIRAKLREAQDHNSKLGVIRAKQFKLYVAKSLGKYVQGRSKVVDQSAFQAVETALPYLIEALTPPDTFKIEHRVIASKEAAENHQELFEDQQRDELKWWKVINKAAKMGLIYGDVHFEAGWESEEEEEETEYYYLTADEIRRIMSEGGRVTKAGEADYDQLGQLLGLKDATVVEVNKIKDGPFVDVISPEDVLVDPATAEEPHKAAMAARALYRDLDWVLSEGEKRGFVGLKEIQADLTERSNGGSQPELILAKDWYSGERQARYHERGLDDPREESKYNADNPGLSPLTVIRGYCKWDRKGDGKLEPVMFYLLAETEKVLGVYKNVYRINPIFKGSLIDAPGQEENISVVDLAEPAQHISTGLLRAINDFMAMVLNPRPIVERDAGVTPNNLQRGGPGTPIWVNAGRTGAVRWDHPVQMPPQVWTYIQAVRDNLERTVGTTAANQGMGSQHLNKTLGGLRELLYQSSRRLLMMALNLAYTGFLPCVKFIVWMNGRFINERVIPRRNGTEVVVDGARLKGNVRLTVNLMPGGSKEANAESASRIWSLLMAILGTPYGQMLIRPENIYEAARIGLASEQREDTHLLINDPRGMMNGGNGDPTNALRGGGGQAVPGGGLHPGLGRVDPAADQNLLSGSDQAGV